MLQWEELSRRVPSPRQPLPGAALDMVTTGMEAAHLALSEPEDQVSQPGDKLIDAVARDPPLAPLLVNLQGLGIDLEGEVGA